MRIPKIYRRSESLTGNPGKTIIEVDALPVVNYVPDVDFDDDKSVERYVKNIKGSIRGSVEYKNLMIFLKERMKYNNCFYLPNIKREKGSKITIEMHHTGFVMEDIIKTVLRKRYAEGEDYDVQSVAEEVMYEHYIGDISLTALSATAHDLIHEEDSGLFIPLHMVDFGDINIFFEKYKEYIPKDTVQKFGQYQILSQAIKNIDEIIPNFLDRNFIYYKVKGEDTKIPDMNKILEIIDLSYCEE